MNLPGKKWAIINADDFGQSTGVNRGVIEGHELGVVTSASLMVRWPAAAEAAAYGREHSTLSLGIHIDLGEWAYREGTWVQLYDVVPLDDIEAVKKETAAQLATFQRLTGKGPTHMDSHQHVHMRQLLQPVFVETAQRLGVPLRRCNPAVRYCGEFYGQTWQGSPLLTNVSTAALIKILSGLPAGFTELECHPAKEVDLDTMYAEERVEELRVLCDPQVRAAIAAMEMELVSFNDILALRRARNHEKLS